MLSLELISSFPSMEFRLLSLITTIITFLHRYNTRSIGNEQSQQVYGIVMLSLNRLSTVYFPHSRITKVCNNHHPHRNHDDGWGNGRNSTMDDFNCSCDRSSFTHYSHVCSINCYYLEIEWNLISHRFFQPRMRYYEFPLDEISKWRDNSAVTVRCFWRAKKNEWNWRRMHS